MPHLDPIEHKRRKEATALRCLDDNGKPLNDASKSVAVQDKRDACDINRITKKLFKNGEVDVAVAQAVMRQPGRFGDFTKFTDYQDLKNRVIRMDRDFMALPPEVRLKFANDPAKLIEYLDQAAKDPKVKAEAIDLGILPKPEIKHLKVETPEGSFWVRTEDGVEVDRQPVKAPAPGA